MLQISRSHSHTVTEKLTQLSLMPSKRQSSSNVPVALSHLKQIPKTNKASPTAGAGRGPKRVFSSDIFGGIFLYVFHCFLNSSHVHRFFLFTFWFQFPRLKTFHLFAPETLDPQRKSEGNLPQRLVWTLLATPGILLNHFGNQQPGNVW